MSGNAGQGQGGSPHQAGATLSDEDGTGVTAGWPEAASTGDSAVDAVLAALHGVGGHPVSAHAELYSAVHDALLAELTTDA